MADNPFVVEADEWDYCVLMGTRCPGVGANGTCNRPECTEMIGKNPNKRDIKAERREYLKRKYMEGNNHDNNNIL